MSPERYARLLRDNDDVAIFASGRQPHDCIWAEFDEAYALANDELTENRILRRFKERLIQHLIEHQP